MSYRTLAALLFLAAPLGCETPIASCFGAGTRIATPDGEVAIETLQVGQPVLAFDEASGAVVQSHVTAVFRHEESRLGQLSLGDGQVLRVTAEHPIYCPSSRRYRPAGELQAGDALLRLLPAQASDGAQRAAQLKQTRLQAALSPLPETQTVYNLSVATYENYFADGVLVHNKSFPRPERLTFPDCLEGQLIAMGPDRTLSCTQALTSGLPPPSCSASGSVLNAYDGIIDCMPKGGGSTHADLRTAIDKAMLDTDAIETTIDALSGSGAAKYCGQYTAATPGQNPSGAIADASGITGVIGAANLCQTVSGCGKSAHMCTVYELYEAAASGSLPTTLPQAWVHMQSWQHNDAAQVPTASGLADNCSGWTYGQDDKLWYGTTVEWKNAPSGHKALHFASGPGLVPCSARFPIACCR